MCDHETQTESGGLLQDFPGAGAKERLSSKLANPRSNGQGSSGGRGPLFGFIFFLSRSDHKGRGFSVQYPLPSTDTFCSLFPSHQNNLIFSTLPLVFLFLLLLLLFGTASFVGLKNVNEELMHLAQLQVDRDGALREALEECEYLRQALLDSEHLHQLHLEQEKMLKVGSSSFLDVAPSCIGVYPHALSSTHSFSLS